MPNDALLYYEPKDDGYGRIFGSLEDTSIWIQFDEFSFQKIDEKAMLIYGFSSSLDPIKKIKKTDEGWRDDKDWEYQPQLIKIEIHKGIWEDKKGKHTPQHHELFIFDWILGNLEEGKIYRGKIEFNSGYESVHQRLNASVLTGSVDENLLSMIFEAVPVDSPEKIKNKPSTNNNYQGGKGKSFKPKIDQIKEMFPSLKDCTTVEGAVYCAVSGFMEDNNNLHTGLQSAIMIKVCFGYDIPFAFLGDPDVMKKTLDDLTEKAKQVNQAESTQLAIDSYPKEATGKEEQKEEIGFSELLAQTNIELKRLGWTSAEGKPILQDRYNKTSRQALTDEELSDFLEYLKKQPSTSEF